MVRTGDPEALCCLQTEDPRSRDPVRRGGTAWIVARSRAMLPNLAGQIGQAAAKHVMAYSARILALIQKIEAADAAHFARLRERGKAQADALAKARAKTLEKKRATLRVARAVQASAAAERKAKS